MTRLPVVLLSLLLAGSLAGCTSMDTPFGSMGEPVSRTTFKDGGSNATTWVLEMTGHFHIPTGTRFQVTADNTTCTTPGLQETGNTTYPCRADKTPLVLYDVTIADEAGDGRPTKGDPLHIVPGAAHNNGTLYGPHRLVLSLHPELPLFVMTQTFGAAGPEGELEVTLMG